MNTTVPLTKFGANLLKEELHQLKTKERRIVIDAIAEARSHGDLSENAEYDAAKERQAFVEGRIAELEGKLSAAQIIDPATLDAEGRVVFASTVNLEDLESGPESDLPDRRHGRSGPEIEQGIGDLADRPRPDRQVRR
jgi:transcription elongation factor GreA